MNVKKIFENFLESRGEISLQGIITKSDRGDGSVNLLRVMLSYRIVAIMVMPQHILRCHHLVGSSFLKVGHVDEEEEEGDVRGGSEEGEGIIINFDTEVGEEECTQ